MNGQLTKRLKMPMKVYSDGACSFKGYAPYAPGGYGAVLINESRNGQLDTVEGYELDTTSIRMEMLGFIEGLKLAISTAVNDCENMSKEKLTENRPAVNVEMYTDSMFIVDSLRKGWLKNWKRTNFKKADGTELKNADLWLEFVDICAWLKVINEKRPYSITFKVLKVKGHSNDTFNDYADDIAVTAKQKAIAEIKNIKKRGG